MKLPVTREEMTAYIERLEAQAAARCSVVTVCSHCGETATNMQPGNGCHSCLQGAMRERKFQA